MTVTILLISAALCCGFAGELLTGKESGGFAGIAICLGIFALAGAIHEATNEGNEGNEGIPHAQPSFPKGGNGPSVTGMFSATKFPDESWATQQGREKAQRDDAGSRSLNDLD